MPSTIAVVGQRVLLLAFTISLTAVAVRSSCRSGDVWRQRSIYFLIIDRFSTDNGTGGTCDGKHLDAYGYCGGTFRGVINQLDYIQGMGFDALWISPVTENAPGGYHGYWPQDLYAINSHFSSTGTSDAAAIELKQLVKAAHDRGMLVMLDVVPNHMGGNTNVDAPYDFFHPFNDSDHYHHVCDTGLCSTAPDSYCTVANEDYTFNSALCEEANPKAIQQCDAYTGLRDLDQSNSFVRSETVEWVRWITSTFDLDGLRGDSWTFMPNDFLQDFTAATSCFLLGEVFVENTCLLAKYQAAKTAQGVTSYPLAFTIRSVFGSNPNPMTDFSYMLREHSELVPDMQLLGTFVDNHDIERYYRVNQDSQAAQSALAYVFLSVGFPILYYGTEQASALDGHLLSGANRVPLWWGGFDTTAPLYRFIALLNNARQKYKIWEYPQVEKHSSRNLYVFTRGPLLIALTNQRNPVNKTLSSTSHNFAPHDTICNVLNLADSCQMIQGDGSIQLVLQNGEQKIMSLRN